MSSTHRYSWIAGRIPDRFASLLLTLLLSAPGATAQTGQSGDDAVPSCRLNGTDADLVSAILTEIMKAWPKSNPMSPLPFDGFSINSVGGPRLLQVTLVTDVRADSAGDDHCPGTRQSPERKKAARAAPNAPDVLTVREVCKPASKRELRCSADAIRSLSKNREEHRLGTGKGEHAVTDPAVNLSLGLLLAHELSHFAHGDAGAAYLAPTIELDLSDPLPVKEQSLQEACLGTPDQEQLRNEDRADQEASFVVRAFLAAEVSATDKKVEEQIEKQETERKASEEKSLRAYDDALKSTVPDPKRRAKMVKDYKEKILLKYAELTRTMEKYGKSGLLEAAHYTAFAGMEMSLIDLRRWDASWRGQKGALAFDDPVAGDDVLEFASWLARRRICDVRTGNAGFALIPNGGSDHSGGSDRVARLSSLLIQVTVPMEKDAQPGGFHIMAQKQADDDNALAKVDGLFVSAFCKQVHAPHFDCKAVPKIFNSKCDELMADLKDKGYSPDTMRTMRNARCSRKITYDNGAR